MIHLSILLYYIIIDYKRTFVLRTRHRYVLKAYSVRHCTRTVPGAENNLCKGKKEALNSFLLIGMGRGKKDKWNLLELRDQEQGSVHQTDK